MGKVPWRPTLEQATAFCWQAKGVRLKLKPTLVSPSEQALSDEAKEPKVLFHPSSISICSWLLFFLRDHILGNCIWEDV